MNSAVNELGQPIGSAVEQPMKVDRPEATSMRGTYCDLISLNVAAHAPELFAAYSAATDDGDWTYLPYGPFTSLGDFTAWAAAMVGLADPVFFTVIDKSDARACGVASYLRITPASASIEVGHIHFSRRLQQTPAATETMYLMMRHAFKLGNRRYEWKCDSLNEPSRKAAQRLGFTFEGTFRQATGYKGRNRDTAWFSIIDTEWPSISAEFQRWLAPSNFDETGNQLTTLGVR